MSKIIVSLAAVACSAAVQAAGLSASHYVQDGLKSCFDGIDNEGTGVHNSSAAVWKDLKSTATLTKNTSYGWWGANHLTTGTNQQTIVDMPIFSSYSISVNVAVNVDYIARTQGTGSTWQTLINTGNVSLHGSGNSSRDFRWFINGNEPRINSGNIYTNTLTGTSDGYAFYVFKDASCSASTSDIQHNASNKGVGARSTDTTWRLTPIDYRDGGATRGVCNARFYGIRVYDRAITANEVTYNNAIDRIRFWDGRIVGDGTTPVAWSSAKWASPEGVAKAKPTADGNGVAAVENATVSVAASDGVNLYALSLENAGKLSLAEGVKVKARFLFVEGEKIGRGIYTGTGSLGTKVDWISGDGVVCVSDSYVADCPEQVAVKGEDGWYEFGLKTGYAYDNNKTFTCHFVDLAKYVFEPNAKVRLVGGFILNMIPAGVFSEIDTSGAKYIVFNKDIAREDGLPFVIPSGATARYQPATWVDQGNNVWKLTNSSGWMFSGDLIVNGTLVTGGDNSHLSQANFSGHITGTGILQATRFQNQNRWRNAVWGFGGTLKAGSNGTLLWIEPSTVTNGLEEIWVHSCADQPKFRTNTTYCTSAIAYGPISTNNISPQELKVKKLTSHQVTAGGVTFRGASDFTDLQGKRWINGSTIIVWGSNTVHAETMDASYHIVARLRDQQGTGGWLNNAIPTFGTGSFIVDKVTNGSNLFLSTNITKVVIGTITGASSIDYTFQSGAVNRATVDITNSCAATATAKATDLAMMPSRLSGFAGKVYLTGEATKSYTIPVDLSQGTDVLYQTVGCIGSGELVDAPAAGTINATFDATKVPVRGSYSLARFTSGGEKLAGWTVLINGEAVNEVEVCGMRVVAKKDASGIYLKVCNPGLSVLLR